MRAMVIREFGGPEVMQLEEVPDPVTGPEDVVFAVHAVSVNRTLDISVRSGRYPRPVTLPHVLGADPAGEIIEVGSAVVDRYVGQRVATFPLISPGTPEAPPRMLGVQHWGGYAERVVVPARVTHLVPDGLDMAQACAVARHAPLAFTLLREKAMLKAGEWILVMGAGGGLGSAGLQVAKHFGARTIAAAGADERVGAAVKLGADHGVNYRSEDLTARVMEITGGKGVDVVFENIGDPELFPAAFASLGRFGRLVTAGSHGGKMVPLDVQRLYLNQITLMGSTRQDPADVDRSLSAAAEGWLHIGIDRIMPLEKAVEAHQLIEARAVSGKIILSPTGSVE